MCIRGRILSGPTGFPITNGNLHMKFDECRFRWNKIGKNLGAGLVFLNFAACSALVPLGDPKMSDLQLTDVVLKVSLKEAQHAMTGLRAEAEVRNQELAENQVIRAQLEGRVRGAEHRVSEARHVIGLQREE